MQNFTELNRQLDAAFKMRQVGNYIGALGQFESLERQSVHPQDIATLRLYQATCLTDIGQPEEANKRLSSSDRSKLVFSKQVDYDYERARIERALGHTDKALDIAEKALGLAAKAVDEDEVRVVSEDLRTLQGILLAEARRCEEAIPMLEAVPPDNPGWGEAGLLLGDCRYKKKLYREAIDCYLKVALETKTVHPIYRNDALRNIGLAYYDLGEYVKAVEYLVKVERAYDDYPDIKAQVFRILASAYSRLGMPQEAARYSGFPRGSRSIQ
jgi:tetratricopeptide (TPR) repeat protein